MERKPPSTRSGQDDLIRFHQWAARQKKLEKEDPTPNVSVALNNGSYQATCRGVYVATRKNIDDLKKIVALRIGKCSFSGPCIQD